MTDDAVIHVLLVDDDDPFREALSDEMGRSGFAIRAIGDAESALREVEDHSFDVAIVDLNLPGLPGEDLIRELRDRAPAMEVIVLTGHATVENAVRTLKDGAYDFLTKPCSLDELEATTRRAFEKRSLLRENRLLQRELARHERFREFVGSSPALRSVLEIIAKVSQTDSTVLIQGESGVGKELAARAIHRNSLRSRQPFIVVDCTSLQESLLQSELFGHERGAFTGAIARKHGLFEVADGGTLFLDEIGEISVPLQSRILRVLDSGTFRRVGGVRDVRVDVRIICATNRDLYRMVQEEKFRQDLYYRINVVSFTLPPLRERRSDIPALAKYFADRSPVARRRPVRFSPGVVSVLQSYAWPGNVRELHNVIERALILADDDEVTVGDLPGNLRQARSPTVRELTARRPGLAELERDYISRLLEEFGGHRARVAEILGISDRTLYRKLKSMSAPRRRRPR
ncbi:MAG: sigma-54-dependent transcriptional regulator [Acidobacteriota bacterium]